MQDILDKEVVDGIDVKGALGIAAGVFVAWKVAQYAEWKVKNVRLNALARDTLKERNAKHFEFKTGHLDVAHILSLDVK